MEGIAQHILYSYQANMYDGELPDEIVLKQEQPRAERARTILEDNPFDESLCNQAYFTPTAELSLDKQFSFEYPRSNQVSFGNPVVPDTYSSTNNHSRTRSMTPSSLSDYQVGSTSVGEQDNLRNGCTHEQPITLLSQRV